MSISDNIQVFIRVRPLNAREEAEDNKSCLYLDRKRHTRLVVDPKDGKTESKPFHFDWIAGESSTQQEIFEVIGKPMADTCLQGYNCCIFAYGQTGAGKTYTMQGKGLEFSTKDDIHCGLQPRILDHIFELKARDEEEHPDVKYSIKCGYLEIYNEQIIDLFNFNSNQKSLNVREDAKEGNYIENLKEIQVNDSQEILKHLQLGARNRHVSSTNMNLESSRSHSLFIMTIQRKVP